jgi:hypothetical protein
MGSKRVVGGVADGGVTMESLGAMMVCQGGGRCRRRRRCRSPKVVWEVVAGRGDGGEIRERLGGVDERHRDVVGGGAGHTLNLAHNQLSTVFNFVTS